MTKTAILLSDYDSCFDVLFMDEFAFKQQFPEDFEEFILARKVLIDKLDQIGRDYDQVELYVGSNRQDHFLNKLRMEENRNGSCFENFEKLCKERGWTFRRLLLPDAQHNFPAGTTMQNKVVRGNWENITETKLEIVKADIDDVKKNHPNSIVDVIFFDDDTEDEYMKSIKNHFQNRLPEHVNKLSLVRYDWCEAVNHRRPSLMSETHMTQPKIELKVKKPRAIQTKNATQFNFGLVYNPKQASMNKKTMAAFSEKKPTQAFFPQVNLPQAKIKRERDIENHEQPMKKAKTF